MRIGGFTHLPAKASSTDAVTRISADAGMKKQLGKQ